MTKTRFCHCNNERVSVWDCDGCPGDYIDYDRYVEPPLYPTGKLAAMSPEQLIAERDRQHRVHDCAVDRCEEINSPTIETAAARSRAVERELESRGFNPNADKPEPCRSADPGPELASQERNP
jgi:hypothetical protein